MPILPISTHFYPSLPFPSLPSCPALLAATPPLAQPTSLSRLDCHFSSASSVITAASMKTATSLTPVRRAASMNNLGGPGSGVDTTINVGTTEWIEQNKYGNRKQRSFDLNAWSRQPT